MSETPFVRTGYATTLFESQLPELLKLLREIAASLKTLAAASARDDDRPKQPDPPASLR